MKPDELLSGSLAIARESANGNTVLTDAKIIAYLLDNCDLTIPENAVFFGTVNCGNVTRHITGNRYAPLYAAVFDAEKRAGTAARAYSGGADHGHTAPVWDDIMTLGLPGLRSRILEYSDSPVNPDFTKAELLVYDAAIRFVRRFAELASSLGKTEMAAGLMHLAENPPSTLYQAMQMIFVFYTLQHYIEGTNLRTLGRLDRLFQPFYEKEEKENSVLLIDQFMMAIDALHADANIPFMLCGSDTDGKDLTNEMSYRILESYIRLKPANVKFHILCTDHTPADFIRLAMNGIKAGANSMVFMNDRMVIRSLEELGQTHEAAADYSVVGCYECGGKEETACTCNGRVNIPKALELALHHGTDVLTGQKIGLETDGIYPAFEDLYQGFCRQLAYLVKQSMEITNGFEKQYPSLHASPFFSSTYAACVRNGGDVFCDNAAPYTNSSINALGLATAVDSLAAIRKLVYEDQKMTLTELTALLDNNWAENPVLHGVILRKFPKYGNGDPHVDALAARLVQDLSDMINNVPNAKGGVYRLGLFSIDWRIDFGAHTAASADGRCNGEPLSQNTGAAFGADREGATAHLLSVTAIDTSHTANGAIVDLDLHASAVRGKNGTAVLTATLQTYLQRGGFAIHYNVLDTEILRDAKAHPEKYPNLQVRLCGWNVKFTELSAAAQDEFIRRSENQAG